MLPPDEIMNAIVAKLDSVPSGDPLAARHNGLSRWFRAFCESLKTHIVHDMPALPYGSNASATPFVGAMQYGVLDAPFLETFAG
jgi:hypothetical protein